MKKSILSLAVLGACALATPTQAADVTPFGNLNEGFVYTHTTGDYLVNKTTFKLDSWITQPTYLGVKGKEKLNDQLETGFYLDNYFDINNGQSAVPSKLFSKEAYLYLENSFGKLVLGRLGGLTTPYSTFDNFFTYTDAFHSLRNDEAFVLMHVLNNAVAYQTPKISGFQGTAIYSFSTDEDYKNKSSENERYLGVGATYTLNDLLLTANYETVYPIGGGKKPERISVGGNYLWDQWQFFARFQYNKHLNDFYDIINSEKIPWDLDLVSASVSVSYTTGPHKFMGGLQGNHLKWTTKLSPKQTVNSYTGLLGYQYSLSAQTSLFADVNLQHIRYHNAPARSNVLTIYSGINHRF